MINLDLQRKRFCVVVGADYVNDFNNKIDVLTTYGWTYSAMLHDKDILENGQLKNKHYHLVITMKNRVRAKQVLKRLCECLECNVENVQIEECFSVCGAIQYLTHKNDKNKYQYDFGSIITNYEIEDIALLYNSSLVDNIEVTTDGLIDICLSCSSRLEIIKKIGIGNYSNYRNTINDILSAVGATFK